MNRNEIELLLSHIEGLQKFLEGNTLEGFRQEILRVEKFLNRFGTLDELIGYIEKIEKVAYVYLANLHTSFLCNLIYPTFTTLLVYIN